MFSLLKKLLIFIKTTDDLDLRSICNNKQKIYIEENGGAGGVECSISPTYLQAAFLGSARLNVGEIDPWPPHFVRLWVNLTN